MLEQRGYNFSVGLAQVNRKNLDKYGLDSYEKAFQACPNLQAGSRILAECYSRSNGSWPKSFSCYYSGDFKTGFRHGYVQKIYASIRATDPVPVDDPRAIEVIGHGTAGSATPVAPLQPQVRDATRIASTWPATAGPANPAPAPVMAQAPARMPVRVSLVGQADAVRSVGRQPDMTDVAALSTSVATAAIEHAQANMDAAFVF
jgi:type IV secretion system protein VirB1